MTCSSLTNIFSVVSLAIFTLLAFNKSKADGAFADHFQGCGAMNKYFIENTMKLVQPDGLKGRSEPQPRNPEQPEDPSSPGGPANLLLKRLAVKRVVFSNLTSHNFEVDVDHDDIIEGKDYSGTNSYIDGVDEPDRLKTNGKRMFVLHRSQLSMVEVLKSGSAGKVVASLTLPSVAFGMFVDGDYVILLHSTYAYKRSAYKRYKEDPSHGERTAMILQVHAANDKLQIVSTLYLEGDFLNNSGYNARKIGSRVYIAVRFNPLDSIYMYRPTSNFTKEQTKKWNREIIKYSQPGNWLPTYMLQISNETRYGTYVSCKNLFTSTNFFSGFDMVTIISIPTNKLMVPRSMSSVMADSDLLFSTKKNIYITTREFHYEDETTFNPQLGVLTNTSIHQFAITKSGASFVASGQFFGKPINQYALSEYNDILYIAAADGATWYNNPKLTETRIRAFKTDPTSRRIKEIGQVGNLGRGSIHYGTRFVGSLAYVFTHYFPKGLLSVVDIGNPEAMKIVGNLSTVGYVSYSHVISRTLLFGVGRTIDSSTGEEGTKTSLLDVTDVTNPKELGTWNVKYSRSSVVTNNGAFLYWKKLQTVVIPLNIFSSGFSGAVVFKLGRSDFKEVGRFEHIIPKLPVYKIISRTSVIDDGNLWSYSFGEALQVNDLFNISNIKKAINLK